MVKYYQIDDNPGVCLMQGEPGSERPGVLVIRRHRAAAFEWWCAGWTARRALRTRRAAGRCVRTLSEMVRLGASSNGRELTDDELDVWVATFPIEAADDKAGVPHRGPAPV